MEISMLELENKTTEELQKIIANAQIQLQEKQKSMRKEVVTKIKELAASIGASVEINFNDLSSKRGGKPGKVTAKYQNPANSEETWTGRGVAPKWIQELTASGRNKDEFLIERSQ
jgi:DNA-binding protein H-NS